MFAQLRLLFYILLKSEMSPFNPYDDYTPSDGIFWEAVVDFILDLGLGLWIFAFSPVGFIVAGLAWITWGGTLLITLAILGFEGCFFGILLGGIALFRFIIFERSKEEPSALTIRLFFAPGVFFLTSSIAGVVTIAHHDWETCGIINPSTDCLC